MDEEGSQHRGVGEGKVKPEGGAEDGEGVGGDSGAGKREQFPEEDGGVGEQQGDVQGLAVRPGLILGHGDVSYARVSCH